MAQVWDKLREAAQDKHPKTHSGYIEYGTAGFRCRGDYLDHVMFRMGALAVIRAKQKGEAIGVMITASHNPEEDNGVKLVDPKGEMLEHAWEEIATKLANADNASVSSQLEELVGRHAIDLDSQGLVFVGQDTRKSSPSLARAALDGIEAAGGVAKDFGIVSTPELHYFVVAHNTNGGYGEPTEEGYINKLTTAFKKFCSKDLANGNYKPSLVFDGANGVGAAKMKAMLPLLEGLNIKVLNDGCQSSDVLNSGCGADFVKVQQKPPKGFSDIRGERCVSIDGDADRVIYFFNDENGVFRMLDGDRIATLVAGFLKEMLSKSHLELNMGLVQTAYANNSSTKYIKNQLNVPVACVDTGVKHLHHKALEFDIGVYFEANGHGTIVFSDKAQNAIKVNAARSNSIYAQKLAVFLDIINQTVGDAISDMLVVEAILHFKGWSVNDWMDAYTDLPCRQTKVKVADRNAITNANPECATLTPKGMQQEIDKAVAKYPEGRCFVRPSGTEDIIRVYSESTTQELADKLAREVEIIVYEMAGGIGERPGQ